MISETSAALRVFSKVKTVDDITKLLQVSATESHSKGDLYSLRNPNSRVHEQTVCIFESSLERTATIEEHLNMIVGFATEKRDSLTNLALECDIDVICSFSSDNGQGGFTIDSAVSSLLGSLGLGLVFDTYLSE